MELLTVYGGKAYVYWELEGLLLAVPVVGENLDYYDACELLCDLGILSTPETWSGGEKVEC